MRKVIFLLLLLACSPSWDPPAGQRIVPGKSKNPVPAFCEVLATFGDRPALAAATAFPHDLPYAGGGPKHRPFKWEFTARDVFAPRGYYRVPGESRGAGILGIGKPLGNGVNVIVSFDVGTRQASALATMFVTIDDVYAAIELPASRSAARRSQYPITGSAQWRQLLENYAASADVIERRVAACASQRRAAR